MSKTRHRGRKLNRGMVCIVLVVCLLAIFMAIKAFSLYKSGQEYSARIEELNTQIEDEQDRKESLEDYAEYIQSDEYVEKIARAKLGLVYKNEIVFKESKDD